MTKAELDALLQAGTVDQAQYDRLLAGIVMLERKEALDARIELETQRKEEFFEEIRVGSVTTQKNLCKRKAGHLSAMAADTDGDWERRELSKNSRRFASAIRGSGISQY